VQGPARSRQQPPRGRWPKIRVCLLSLSWGSSLDFGRYALPPPFRMSSAEPIGLRLFERTVWRQFI
jgi:hypothetical protein